VGSKQNQQTDFVAKVLNSAQSLTLITEKPSKTKKKVKTQKDSSGWTFC